MDGSSNEAHPGRLCAGTFEMAPARLGEILLPSRTLIDMEHSVNNILRRPLPPITLAQGCGVRLIAKAAD
jgi:hypothetical protein